MKRLPTTLLTLALYGTAWAGPVASEQADAALAAGSGASPAAKTQVSAASAVSQGLPELGRAAGDAASAPSGSALVLEMLQEAGAGAPGHDAAHPSRRPANAAAPVVVAKKAKQDDDPWGLRDIGKTALRWVKGAVPWLGDDEPAHDDKPQALHSADWSAAPLEGGTARGTRPGASPTPHGATDPPHQVGYADADQPRAAGADDNLMREIVDVLRLVLEHPMTWLVVALFAVGGIVVKRIDRRPTK